MKYKIYYSDIIAFLFFHIGFLTFPYFEQYNLLKYSIIVIVFVYLFCNYKIIFEKKYRVFDVVLLMFLLVVLITGYINRNELKERDVFLAAIVFVLIVMDAFFLFQCFEHKRVLGRTIIIVYHLTALYVVLTDIILVVNQDLVVEKEGYYLIGNKFSVVFAHYLMICLYWYVKCNKKKILIINKSILALMYVLTFSVALFVECATGVVGCVLLFTLMMFRKRITLVCVKPIVPIIVLCIACSVLLVSDVMTNNYFVRFIVEDVLQRDISLTGRMGIYTSMYELFPGHYWSGYGYGSTYEVCMKLLGAPNTQNGLMEIVVQFGLVGAGLFLVLIFFAFRQNSYQNNRRYSMPIISLLYVYIILASVEITLELQFLVLLAIMVASAEMEKKDIISI